MLVDVWADAGHGGDTGAYDPISEPDGDVLDTREDDPALAVTLLFGKACERSGLTVGYTRKTNISVPLSERTLDANAAQAQFFISFHFNAYSDPVARGIEVYAFAAGTTGDTLAKQIYGAITPLTPWSDRGVKYNTNWVVLRDTYMPAVLIEGGFITNTEEEKLIHTSAYQNALAETVAKVVVETLGRTYVSPQADPLPTAPEYNFEELMLALDEARLIASVLQSQKNAESDEIIGLQISLTEAYAAKESVESALETEQLSHRATLTSLQKITNLVEQLKTLINST